MRNNGSSLLNETKSAISDLSDFPKNEQNSFRGFKKTSSSY